MKKRMRILTFLLAGVMVFTGVPGSGMLSAASGTVVAYAATEVEIPTTLGASTDATVTGVTLKDGAEEDAKTLTPTADGSNTYKVSYTGADLTPVITATKSDGVATADTDYVAEYYKTSTTVGKMEKIDDIGSDPIKEPGTYYILLQNKDNNSSSDKYYAVQYEVEPCDLSTLTTDDVTVTASTLQATTAKDGYTVGWGTTSASTGAEIKTCISTVKASGSAEDALASDKATITITKDGSTNDLSTNSTDALSMGTYTITIKAEDTATHYKGQKTFSLKVNPATEPGEDGKRDLSGAGIGFSITEKQAEGQPAGTPQTDIRKITYSSAYAVDGGADACTTTTALTVAADNSTNVAGATYTGKPISFKVNVTSSGEMLNEGEDYTISYQKAIPASGSPDYANLKADTTQDGLTSITDAGYYYIVITGTSQYKGTVKIPFYIAKQSTVGYQITPGEQNIEFTGAAADVDIEISSGTGNNKKTITPSEYDVKYYKVKDPGTELRTGGALYDKTMSALASAMTSDQTYCEAAADTITQPGKYAIIATPKASGNYDGTLIYTTAGPTANQYTAAVVDVTKPLKDADVTPYIKNTGTAEAPAYTADCLVVSDGKRLVADTDVTVKYYNAAGTELTGGALTSLSADTSYTVRIEGMGDYTGRISKTFAVSSTAKNLEDATVVAADAKYTGSPVTTALGIFLGTESVTGGYTPVYVNNTQVNTNADNNNTIDDDEAGVYVVGDGVQYYGIKAKDFKITQAGADQLNVSTIADQTYGTVSAPSFTVTDATGKELVRGNDYEVAYSKSVESILAAVTYGGASAQLTGAEQASYLAAIKSAGVDAYLASIAASTDAKDVAVRTALGASANYSAAFTGQVEDAGTYIVRVTAASAEYSGQTYKLFSVNPVDLDAYNWTVGYDDGRNNDTDTIAKNNGKIPYTGENLADDIKNNYLSISTGEGSARQEIKIADADITVTPADASVKEITEPGKYSVKVEASGNYKGSKTLELEVAKVLNGSTDAKVAVGGTKEGSGNTATYTYEPKASVTYQNKALVEGTDYTVEYYASTGEGSTTPTGGAFTSVNSATMTNNTQNYVAVIKGMGDYEGTHSQAFTISKNQVNDLSEATVAFTNASGYSTVYTGAEIKPSSSLLTVKMADGTAVTSANYDVFYSNNVDASGEAAMTLVGKGTYFGQVSVKFTITPKSVSGVSAAIDSEPETITAASGSVPAYAAYAGKAFDVDMLMNDAVAGAKLKKDKDYTLSFAKAALDANGKAQQNADGSYQTEGSALEEIKDVGIYVVMAAAKGNYEGSKYALFEIRQADKFAFTVAAKDQKYTGEAITNPSFLFYDENGGAITVDEKDYTVKIYDADNQNEVQAVEEGTYTARLTGAGNYSDKASAAIRFNVTASPADQDVTEIQKELDAAKEELEAAKKDLEEAKKDSEASKAEVDRLTQEVADQQAAVDDLKKQIEELQNQKAVDQKITITKKAKTFKAKNLKAKKGTFNIKAAAQTSLSYKTVKADSKKKVTVKSNGKVVVKKGTKAGTYKVKVKAVAAKAGVYNKATKNFMVTVTVK